MQISRKTNRGLKEIVFRRSDLVPISYYATDAISLPHDEYILFEGYITKWAGHEEEKLRKYFKGGNNIHDLIEEAQDWDGCWSIVYINERGTIYCFTDPLGKKQLYYDENGNIASSILPLAKNVSYELDPLYLGEIHKWGYNVDDLTPFKGVKRVMPNKVYMFVAGVLQGIDPRPYYDFKWSVPKLSPSAFRDLIVNSIEEYAKGLDNVKSVAVLLSGGIDSSIISFELLGLKRLGKFKPELHFYTINNQEDAPFVEIFAKRFGIQVKTLSYNMETARLTDALIINETPIDLGSMVPNQLMFQAIPERVIFTGDGPDELFGGYRRTDEYDSQKSDVFHELAFYHLPRLDKAATHFGKDLRCPWLSYDIVRYALTLPFEDRKHKACMKEAYRGILPDEIIDRPKLPLKNDLLRKDPMEYRKKLLALFEETFTNFDKPEYENQ